MSTLTLPYAPPYDWPAMLAFLAARAVPTVEIVTGGRYRRSLRLTVDGTPVAGTLEVRDEPSRRRLAVTLSPSLADAKTAVKARLAHLFDTRCDPVAITAALGALAEPAPGLRLPGAVDPFELTVRAILGQQVTVAAARTLASRLVARFGGPLPERSTADPTSGATDWPSHLFPAAATIAAATPDTLGELGIIRSRGGAIIAIARAIDRGDLVLAPGAPVPEALTALTAITGIGPWTAHYIAMRCLGWTDAFPPRDVAVLKALGVTSPAAAAALAEEWRPWRAYAVLHLWRQVARPVAAGRGTAGPRTARSGL